MRKFILAAVLSLPATIISQAMADPLVEESVPSSISITKEGEYFRIVTDSHRFQTNIFVSRSGRSDTLYQLLKIEEHQISVEAPQTDYYSNEAKAKVTAYSLTEKGKGDALFTIEGKADEVKAQGPFLTLARYGCCVEIPTYAIYSLESGKYLFNSSGEGESWQRATMGAQGGFDFHRIFAYHAKITAADDELFGEETNGAVILAYAKDNEPLQRIMLVASHADIESNAFLEWIPKIDLVSASYPKGIDHIYVDRKGKPEDLFTDVTLRLTLDEVTVVEIPLVADKLNINAAKLPQGYILKEMKL